MKVRFLIMVFLLTVASHGRSAMPAPAQPVCKGGEFLGLALVPLPPRKGPQA
jgi:hypothetical protein